MALFSQNTLTQVSGFDNPIIAGELVYNQKTFWNLALTSAGSPVNLTGATISASIVRRTISNLVDTRNGLTFNIGNYTPTPTAVALTISNLVAASGTFTLVIDDSTWALVVGDPELDISATEPVAFSGRLKMSFPASGATPAEDNIIFLLFLVRSDGIINT
jgi:hypothetical protein